MQSSVRDWVLSTTPIHSRDNTVPRYTRSYQVSFTTLTQLLHSFDLSYSPPSSRCFGFTSSSISLFPPPTSFFHLPLCRLPLHASILYCHSVRSKHAAMDRNMNTTNGYAPSTARQDARNMPLSTGSNGYPVSAAMLMDPKSMKQQMANGTYFTSLNPVVAPSAFFLLRPQSEPPHLSTFPHTFNLTLHKSKDDAHFSLQGHARGRLAPNQNGPSQTSLPRFDPRQLLNPKGFGTTQLRTDEEAPTSLSASPLSSSNATNSNGTHPNGVHKRGNEEVERGMGGLIERMHNVSKREDRPQKKQKREHIGEDVDDEQGKAVFTGGGKGGEIGEYMKQKRREGQQEVGLTNTVVDLTAGTSFCWLASRKPMLTAPFRRR